MLRRLRPNRPDETSDKPEIPVVQADVQAPAASPRAEDVSSKGRMARLGEILLEERIITPKQLEEGLAKKREVGGFLGQALVDLGHIDQDTLTLILVKQCKIPHLNLHEYSIGNEVLALMPRELCGKYHVLPVDKMGKILTIAMVDPLDVDALTAVRAAFPDLRIKPILCDWSHFHEVFQRMQPSTAPSSAPASAAPQSVQAQEPSKNPAPAVPRGPETAPKPVRESAAIAIDSASITAAIREGMRDTVAQFEQKLAEASELLRAIQNTERNFVANQTKQDLGVATESAAGRKNSASDDGAFDDLERREPQPAYSFTGFIAGSANKNALEMAQAAARGAGSEFNPLFVCGDVGLGKTHLISAIGNALLSRGKGLCIGWTSAGRFADHAIAALEQKNQEEFRRAYSRWDALILDDIQFLGGRIEAQEELFHVFNALQERGRQIVIAGDRMPEKLGLLEKRLISRFDSGQVVRIVPPEWETRLKILQQHAKQMETTAPDDVLAMLAMRYPSDVRRLIGALRKVAARAKLQGGAMTAALAGEVLADGGAEAAA